MTLLIIFISACVGVHMWRRPNMNYVSEYIHLNASVLLLLVYKITGPYQHMNMHVLVLTVTMLSSIKQAT